MTIIGNLRRVGQEIGGLLRNKKKAVNYDLLDEIDSDSFTRDLRDLLKRSVETTHKKNIVEDIIRAVKFAVMVGRERGVNYDKALFANPLLMVPRLLDYGLNAEGIIAAIIYPVLRADEGKQNRKTWKSLEKYMQAAKTGFGRDVFRYICGTLTLRDMPFLSRLEAPEIENIIQTSLEHSSEKDWYKKFIGMGIRGGVNDGTEAATRLTQYLFYLETLSDDIDEQKRSEILNRLDYFYIPMAAALDNPQQTWIEFRKIRRDLEIMRLKIANPKGYREALELQEEHTADFLKWNLALAPQDADLSCEEQFKSAQKRLQKLLKNSVPPDIAPYCEVQTRIKDIFSILDKIEKFKRKPPEEQLKKPLNLRDIVGARLIFKIPKEQYEHLTHSDGSPLTSEERLQFIKDKERQWSEQAFDYMHVVFNFDPNRDKNFWEDPFDKGRRKVDNGYRAAQSIAESLSLTGLQFLGYSPDRKDLANTGAIEIQFLGEETHETNEKDLAASHSGHKGYGDFIKIGREIMSESLGSAPKLISIVGPGNDIYEIPEGSNVIDLAARLHKELPDIAFFVRTVKIHRVVYPKDPDTDLSSLSTPLISGDRVDIKWDGSLIHDPGIRWRRICDCANDNTRGILWNIHNERASKEPLPDNVVRLSLQAKQGVTGSRSTAIPDPSPAKPTGGSGATVPSGSAAAPS